MNSGARTAESFYRYPRTVAALGAAALVILVIALAGGCSDIDAPESQGTIQVRLYLYEPAGEGIARTPAQISVDSVVVHVFRGGTGVNHETSRGAAVSGPSQVDLTVTCIAEADKKVSVELFDGSDMMYFGVDEHVDVVENQNTSVTIVAADMYVDYLDVTPQLSVYNPSDPPSHNVTWPSAPAAASYLVLESPEPGFPQQLTQTFLTTSTVMTFQRPPGAYYYMVAPLNAYTVGSPTDIGYTYVQGQNEQPPQIDEVDLLNGPPGTRVTLSGRNLDVPGRVQIGPVICPTLSARETELVFVVPLTAHTGDIAFYHVMGGVAQPPSERTFVVERIAYVTRESTGDPVTRAYVDLISGEPSITSGVALVPPAELADRDMWVFDLIIVADDVTVGLVEAQAIAGSGAQVLAVGTGGVAYLSLAYAQLNGNVVPTTSNERFLNVIEPAPVFESPQQIPEQGPGLVEISAKDPGEPFRSFDFGGSPPAALTRFASLAGAPAHDVLFDFVAADAVQREIHNVFWGHEGNPANLIQSTGGQLLINVITHLLGPQIAVPESPPATRP